MQDINQPIMYKLVTSGFSQSDGMYFPNEFVVSSTESTDYNVPPLLKTIGDGSIVLVAGLNAIFFAGTCRDKLVQLRLSSMAAAADRLASFLLLPVPDAVRLPT